MRNGRFEVFSVFLKIGALGFGVAAIWGLIQAEAQEKRKWLSKERFVEGLALVQALVPYASAVATEKWEDRKDGSTVIHQQIYVERDSQKAIVVGKGGSRLKQIGAAAREAISEHLGRKVHLFLHVKVSPKWGEDRGLYEDIGLDWAD